MIEDLKHELNKSFLKIQKNSSKKYEEMNKTAQDLKMGIE